MARSKCKKYRTDDQYFMGIRRIDASPEDIFRAMFDNADRERDKKLAEKRARMDGENHE